MGIDFSIMVLPSGSGKPPMTIRQNSPTVWESTTCNALSKRPKLTLAFSSAVTVAIEAGLVESKEGENEVVLDAPAGLIRTTAIVKDGKVESVTLTNVPAFVYKENQ